MIKYFKVKKDIEKENGYSIFYGEKCVMTVDNAEEIMARSVGYSLNFMEVIAGIDNWAHDRNLIKGSDPKSQLLKTMSELGELADGINKNRREEIIDGIGDVVVTLVIIAGQLGLGFPECVASAYDEIKDRKGRMENGVFIKEGDEPK